MPYIITRDRKVVYETSSEADACGYMAMQTCATRQAVRRGLRCHPTLRCFTASGPLGFYRCEYRFLKELS